MADSKYPGQLDTDAEMPRVDDNITEIGGEAINAVRSATFNIEETLGTNPQGSAADLTTRLSAALNDDGTLKASALAAVAVVTLPITNSMIAPSADIEESKLDLDHSTVSLKSLIDWNFAEIKKLMSAVTVDIGHLASHVSHPSTWGRHHTSDIDGYTGATYDGYNLQGIVEDLNTRIINHLADTTDAHDASAISFDDTLVTVTADNVQDAIVETDRLIEGATIIHQDHQHSNGVLKAQEVVYNDSNHSYVVVVSSVIQNVSIGAIAIQFVIKPDGFDLVKRGDTIDISIGGAIYRRYVNTTDTTNAILYFFEPIPVSGTGASATVYKDSAEALAPSSLNFGIRRKDVAGTGGSVIQMVHPSAPYVISSECDPRGLNDVTSANVRFTWATGDTGNVDAYTLMSTFSTSPNTWTVENLSMVLNEEFADQHYPIISFTYRGEIGFALDEPDGYLHLAAPTARAAWSVLGLTQSETAFALDRGFYVDGYRFTGLRTIIDAYGDVDAGNTNEITNITKDLRTAGLKASGVIRVKNSAGDDGTYVFDQVNDSDTLTIGEHSFSVDNDVRIISYADSFSVPSIPAQRTLYELFVDGYDHITAVFRGAKRLEYTKEPSTSTQDISGFFDVTDISRDFLAGERRILVIENSGEYTIALGTRGSGNSLALSGPNVGLPAASSEVVGYKARLYDYNEVDYVEIQVAQNYSPVSGSQALDVTAHDRMSEERYLQVGKVLHDKTEFKHMADRRLFGNVGRKDVRDDFTRDYTSYPRSVMRGNGIIHGFEMNASVGGLAFGVDGGEIVVNGTLYTIPYKEFVVPTDNTGGEYNVYVDTDGVMRFEKDDSTDTKNLSPSVAEIIESADKTILWQFTLHTTNQILSWIDLRRYVSNLDNRVDLVWGQGNTMTGSFDTLRAAINYLEAAGSGNTLSRVIRIHGSVFHSIADGPIELPANTVLEGDVAGRGQPGGWRGAKIGIGGDGTDFIHPGPGCTVRNLAFTMEGESTNVRILFGGEAVQDFVLENCNFENLSSTNSYLNVIGGSGVLINAIDNVYVNNCTFDFSDSDTDNNVFNAALGYIWRLTVTNCEASFSASDASSWFIISVALTDSIVDNCFLTFPELGTGSLSAIQCSLWINNCRVQNNLFRNPVAHDNTVAITAPLISETSITGNRFEKFYRNIWGGSVIANTNYIVDNRMLQVGFTGIKHDNFMSTVIENNYLNSYSSGSDMTLVKLTNPWFCTVRANTMASFIGSAVADGYMVRIHNGSISNLIAENVLVNSVTSNVGFENGIVLDGEGGGHLYDSIVGNKLTLFNGGSCRGIYLADTTQTLVDGNLTALVRAPLHTYNAVGTTVTNNTFDAIGSSDAAILKMDGSLAQSLNIITHNRFVADTPGDEVVELTSGSGGGGIFADNYINVTISTLLNILKIADDDYIITGNGVAIPTNALSALPMATMSGDGCVINNNNFFNVINSLTAPVLLVSGDNCIVATNNLSRANSIPSRLSITGSHTVDIMNRGATYTAPLSLARGDFDAWTKSVFIDKLYYSTSGSDQTGVEFTSADIPAGALLISVKIRWQTANTSYMSARWYETDWDDNTSGTLLVGTTYPAGTSAETITLTAPASTYMNDDEVHLVRITTTNGPSYVYGVLVTYVL
jgi:hypothetical protein